MLQNFFSPVTDLPTPKNISWFWLGGSLLGFTLVFQLISGYLLSIYYTSNSDFAFSCVDSISRDINYGEIVRHFHIFGASFFFLVVYFHIGRGLYYLSFNKNIMAWNTGVVLYILLMATSFVGYVLPWAQMSFWAATVITNFITVIPFVGQSLVIWVWGSFSVDYTTLIRFYTLHFLLPSIIALFSCIHIWFLHYTGSSNPLGVGSDGSLQRFSTFSGVKDLLGLFVIFLSFLSLYLINPMIVNDSEQMIEANPFVTPVHIVPEWYFLPAYAILRSVPNKLGGVICLVLFILVLFVYPFLISSFFNTNNISVFSIFFFDCEFLNLFF